jgi:hypothetical protein
VPTMSSRLYFFAAEAVGLLGVLGLLALLGLLGLLGVVLDVVELLEQALTTTRASATAGTEIVLARNLRDIVVLLRGLFLLSLPISRR